VSPVLADTSVWLRRAQPDVADAIADAVDADEMMVTTAVELELLRTAQSAAELVLLRREHESLRRAPLGEAVEQRAKDVQRALSWRGYHRGPSPVDLLAAAAAEAAGAELWHCDKHFELIADVTGQPIRKLGR
jgi:predicted nucleic acid-binding protein